MEAPVLPPSQQNVPAVVANSTNFLAKPPVEAAAESGAPSLGPAGVPTSNLPLSPLSSIQPNPSASVAEPLSWLSSSQLAHSFRFLSQAFRSAQSDSVLTGLLSNRVLSFSSSSRYSAVLPFQSVLSNNRQSWTTANVQVNPVAAADPIAQDESKAWTEPYAEQCLPKGPSLIKRELNRGAAYRIGLGGKTLGYVADKDRAQLLAQHLQRLVRQGSFEAETVAPQLILKDSATAVLQTNEPQTHKPQAPSIKVAADGYPLFAIEASMAEDVGYSKEWAAVAWANNLRVALDAEPLSVGAAHSGLKNLAASEISMQGEASWYGPYFHGRMTANGETYNQHDLTVAHKSLPFGTYLQVRNLDNDKTVVVRVNDRGPYVGDRSLDLSHAAAQCLGSDEVGVIPYEAVILKEGKTRS